MTISPPTEDTWLVIPLYNEATVIEEVLAQDRGTFPPVV